MEKLLKETHSQLSEPLNLEDLVSNHHHCERRSTCSSRRTWAPRLASWRVAQEPQIPAPAIQQSPATDQSSGDGDGDGDVDGADTSDII